LGRADALPPALARATPGLAAWVADGWRRPDHGIWEVRGPARCYAYSRVAAWAGLGAAASLAGAGQVTGDPAAWVQTAQRIRAFVLRRCVDGQGALTLHDHGGGPDAALAKAVSSGFLAAGDPRAAATLDAISGRLLRGGLTDRYLGQPDGLPGSCAPFVFPTFWLAEALDCCARDGAPSFAAAAAARGPLDLLGEVADPTGGRPLGNYPQVQSHAALVLAALRRPGAPAPG